YLPYRYENPFLTATSRALIADISALTRRLSNLDVPRPLAVLYHLLGISSESSPDAIIPEHVLFRAVRAWTEVEEVSEAESFDGHKRCMVEHTLHVLLLPGMHTERYADPPTEQRRRLRSDSTLSIGSASVPSSITSHAPAAHPSDPALLSLPLPSPLHLTLPITSHLSFNEAGRITRHRDTIDLRDALTLLPGMGIAQYIGSRLAAHGLSWAVKAGRWAFSPSGSNASARAVVRDRDSDRDRARKDSALERGKASAEPYAGGGAGLTPAEAYARGAMRWLTTSMGSSYSSASGR
ncbi:hypothetical protein PUNSTDRAFT_64934, partial [Punctularia strigosozonata HHB-11173 SS5]|uniref:uncharacterized protein n=1 Tax=Punctularia strigosozonata (strain HHB-11173) TaxID=741275 RepID=UPI0004417DEF